MALVIKNGLITTASDQYTADILCEGEAITSIGRNLAVPAGSEVIDATGKLVFPGFIDPHVHIYLPFMGTYAKDDYDSGSRAALVGGTTTLIEMCCPSRQDEPLEALDLWLSKAQGISACDFTFHMAVSRYDQLAEEQLRQIVKRGIASFKIFLAYKGAFGIDDTELFNTLRLAKELGVIVTAHCENETLVTELQKRLLAEGKTGPEWHEPSRPVRVEAEGVHHLMTFAELTVRMFTSCIQAMTLRFKRPLPRAAVAYTSGSKPWHRISCSTNRMRGSQILRAPSTSCRRRCDRRVIRKRFGMHLALAR